MPAHRVQYFVCDILGMRCREPYAEIRMNGGDPLQQAGKIHDIGGAGSLQACLVVLRCAPFIGVDILPKERDLPVSIVEKFFGFTHDRLRVATPFTAPGKGYNTKRAHIVTSPHDRNESSDSIRVEPH